MNIEKIIGIALDSGADAIHPGYGFLAENQKFGEECEKNGFSLFMPELKYCGDNAAMVGAQGYYEFLAGNTADMSLNAYATKSILGEAL